MMSTLQDARRAAVQAMVRDIGSQPMQDIHYDAWFYPGQSSEVFGLQPYEHSVIRQYLKVTGGDSPPPVLVAMADYLMLDPAFATT